MKTKDHPPTTPPHLYYKHVNQHNGTCSTLRGVTPFQPPASIHTKRPCIRIYHLVNKIASLYPYMHEDLIRGWL